MAQYGAALARAETEAVASGSLAAVEAVESERGETERLAAVAAALPETWEIESFAAPAPLPDSVGSELVRMRGTLERELVRIDVELAAGFDRELQRWEEELKRAGEGEAAGDVGQYRRTRLAELLEGTLIR